MLGRLRRAIAEAERAATSSLAAVSDNPVFVPPCEGHPLGATLSNGSYHNAQAPPAMDGLSTAWADVYQRLLERQTERLLTDPTVFGEGHVPVKILYMVQTWWAEEARSAAQPTLIPLGGYGQNDTCAPSFFAWRRQEQVGRCLDAALAIVAAISSQALAEGGRQAPPALAGLLADVRARFPVVKRAFAGFVEPGESLEECAARELEEEVGIEVGDIAYFASQPWPFPHCDPTWRSGDLRIEEAELATRAGSRATTCPRGRLSIARRLIDDWL